MTTEFGIFLFRYRNALFPLACTLLLLSGPPLVADPLFAAILGAAVASVGQLVRALTIGLRYIVRGGRGGRVYADDLVTEGVYTVCRNPMYVGNVLIVVGVAIASNSAATLALAIPLVVFAYAAIVAAEEQFLRGKFGPAYDAYCKEVPRWYPRLAAVRGAFAFGTFRWRRVLVKEYGTPFGWVSAVCLVALYNFWRTDALGTNGAAAHVLIAVMVLTTLLWATAWILKKTRLVVAD